MAFRHVSLHTNSRLDCDKWPNTDRTEVEGRIVSERSRMEQAHWEQEAYGARSAGTVQESNGGYVVRQLAGGYLDPETMQK